MVEHRPLYHFQPPSDWMNDPKLFFWKGEYHVFLQYAPKGMWETTRYWGHTVSRDLVHWEWLPVALIPTPGGPDSGGCWTGSVVEDQGRFHILYTGVPPQTQCLATGDDLIHWQKYPGNPVMPQSLIPQGFVRSCWRDPCAWKEGDTWYVIIGSAAADGNGAALLYESTDLVHWKYLHPLCIGEKTETGRMFECPDFFKLGDKHVLISSCSYTYWRTGAYRDHKFIEEKLGLMDGGFNVFYSAKTLLDDQGRRILFGWIAETRPMAEQLKAGWSGLLSLPREMKLRPDGGISFEPVREVESLRGRHWHFENIQVGEEIRKPIQDLEGIQGDTLEIIVKFEPTGAAEFGLAVRCAPVRPADSGPKWPATAECKELCYLRDTHRLNGAPLTLRRDEGLELRVFVDRSAIEVFANGGRACLTERFYPTREDSLGVAVFARSGGTARVKSVDVWEMKSR